MYKIIRHYQRSRSRNRRTVSSTRLTLEEARAWCSAPEASSTTLPTGRQQAPHRRAGALVRRLRRDVKG